MIKDYFTTPVGFYNFKVTETLRKDLIDASNKGFKNLWEDATLSKEMSNLYYFICNNVNEYSYKQNFKNYMSTVRPMMVESTMNWQYPGEWFALHSHTHSHIASVFYLCAPENCGDLLLVDPRGDNNWTDRIDHGVLNTSYEKIKPVEGLLVVFPAWLSHMVEPNTSEFVRISLVTNFYLKRQYS